MTYLDTHVVAWLFDGKTDLLSQRAARMLEAETLLISPIVHLELHFLHEIGRLRTHPSLILRKLAEALDLRSCDLPFHAVVQAATSEDWTRDPFDRIIVAHAKVANGFLISRDERIRRHYRRAVW